MKRLIASVSLAMAALVGFASPVTSDEAALAVETWLGFKAQLDCRLGAAVAEARTCSPTNDVSFHVVKLEGGGFVVTSADDEIEPILAFSESGDLVESEENPLWTLLRRDLTSRTAQCRQRQFASAGASAKPVSDAAAKWARLLPSKATGAEARSVQAATGKQTVSDVRVAPLLQSKWSQEQDAFYSNMGSPCYNYYTPNNFPCGCVATAGAQVMRYHRFPTAYVTPGTYACKVETGKNWIDAYSYYPIYENRNLTMQGGYYDWDSMPLVPADGTTLAQRKAIGKLTSDVGITCLMSYGEGGSSSGDYMLSRSLPERFGYANAVAACGSSFAASFVRKVLISNLDAKLPVVLGLSGSSGGHAVVADGYGYSLSTFYAHFNVGWAGTDDAWYAPPDVADYDVVNSIVYNIYPSGVANGVICSGRVLSSSGSPVSGATVSVAGDSSASATTDAKGIYAFVLKPGSYTVSSGNASQAVTLVANVGTTVKDNGYYQTTPKAEVNNVCNFDLTVSGAPVVTTHTVTFNLGSHGTRTGGGALTQTVADGGSATAPTVAASEGWTFTGWDKAFTNVKGDLTVTAQYEEVPVVEPEDSRLVVFDANGGKCAVASQRYVEGDVYDSLPTPAARKGYAFVGWWTAKVGGELVQEGDAVDFSLFGEKTPTLYARWGKAYTLTLKGMDATAEYEGETYESTVSVPEGGVVLLWAPDYYDDGNGVGYVFQCWTTSKAHDLGEAYSAASIETAIVMPAADLTMTATFVKESEAAWLTMYAFAEPVEADGFTIEPDESQFLWSVDGKTWFASGTETLVKRGTYSVQWKSASNAWAAPTAKTKVTLAAGEGYDNADSPVEFTFVRAASVAAVLYEDGEWFESRVGGTVTMSPTNGQIQKGKTVTLSAKASAGHVFVGWQLEKHWCEYGLVPLATTPTLKLDALPDDCMDESDFTVHYQAVFRPLSDYAEDGVRNVFQYVRAGTSEREVSYDEDDFSGSAEVKIGLGCAADIGLCCSAEALPLTFRLSGTLPKGLKFDASTGVLKGTPTVAGTYPLVVTATDPAGNACRLTMTLVVKSVYSAIAGDWRALLADEDGVTAGLFEMSVTESGKASGKITTASGTTSVTPTVVWTPDEEDPDGDGMFEVYFVKETGSAKSGSLVDFWFAPGDEGYEVGFYSSAWKNGEETSHVSLSGMAMRSSSWILSDKSFQEMFLSKYYTVVLTAGEGAADGYRTPEELMAPGYLTVTVDKKGSVKVAGKLSDGEKLSASTVLLPSEYGDGASALLFVVPSGYKKQGSVALRLDFGPDGQVASSDGVWVTPPLLTAVSDDGEEIFRPGMLLLSANGRVYSALSDLTGHYLSLSVGEGAAEPVLEYSYADSEKVKRYESVGSVFSSYELGENMLTGGKSGKVTVGKSAAPWKDAEGYWHYEETKEDMKTGETQPILNPSGLTISFKSATGVFSGKFNLFFDYDVPQYDRYGNEKDPKKEHKSVSCAYEGVLVGDGSSYVGSGSAQYAGKFTYEYWVVDKNGNEKSATKTYTRKYALPVSWSVE